jgi:hypothetical protein
VSLEVRRAERSSEPGRQSSSRVKQRAARIIVGCTDRSAKLGIHRTQAGRRGSRLGRDQRAEARCSTTTPSIDSVASATDPGRSAAGSWREVPPGAHHPCRPVRRTHGHRPRPPPRQRSRRGASPSPLPAAVAARARYPARDYSSPGWEGRLRHPLRPPQRAVAGGARAVARAGPRGSPNCAARCGSPGRRSDHQGDGSQDCIAIVGPGAGRPDVGGGGIAGTGAPADIA